jgi:hypothetical protein
MSRRRQTKICICGPRPLGLITGVALAFHLLIEGLALERVPNVAIDTTRGGVVSKSGTFTLRRAWDTLYVILLVWWHLLSCKIYYATMSTSSVGFIRDYLTVSFAKLLGRRTVPVLTSPKQLFQQLVMGIIRDRPSRVISCKLSSLFGT